MSVPTATSFSPALVLNAVAIPSFAPHLNVITVPKKNGNIKGATVRAIAPLYFAILSDFIK